MKTEKRAYAVVVDGPWGLMTVGDTLAAAGFQPGDRIEIRPREVPSGQCSSCASGEHVCSSDFCECECPASWPSEKPAEIRPREAGLHDPTWFAGQRCSCGAVAAPSSGPLAAGHGLSECHGSITPDKPAEIRPRVAPEIEALLKKAVQQKEEREALLAAMTPEQRDEYWREWAESIAPQIVEDGCAIDRALSGQPCAAPPTAPEGQEVARGQAMGDQAIAILKERDATEKRLAGQEVPSALPPTCGARDWVGVYDFSEPCTSLLPCGKHTPRPALPEEVVCDQGRNPAEVAESRSAPHPKSENCLRPRPAHPPSPVLGEKEVRDREPPEYEKLLAEVELEKAAHANATEHMGAAFERERHLRRALGRLIEVAQRQWDEKPAKASDPSRINEAREALNLPSAEPVSAAPVDPVGGEPRATPATPAEPEKLGEAGLVICARRDDPHQPDSHGWLGGSRCLTPRAAPSPSAIATKGEREC